ncbi:MAG: hypothetical protein ACFFED_04255 [Candidatus Thorarchaeota archaeon]
MNDIETKHIDRICAWCGKPGANSAFSGSKIHYCNFRCATAKDFFLAIVIFAVFLAVDLFLIAFFPDSFIVFVDHFQLFPFLLPEVFALGTFAIFFFFTSCTGYALFEAQKLRSEKRSKGYV